MPYYPTTTFGYGSIIIDRHELVSMKFSTRLNQHLAERVTYSSKIIPQSNDFNYCFISLRVEQAKYDQWLAYFVNAPNNLQNDLLLGQFSSIMYVLESMDVEYSKIVKDETGQIKILYNLDLSFIRAL